jgi:hypothetical protein
MNAFTIGSVGTEAVIVCGNIRSSNLSPRQRRFMRRVAAAIAATRRLPSHHKRACVGRLHGRVQAETEKLKFILFVRVSM